MLTNHQANRIAISDLQTPVQELTRREAILVNGGNKKGVKQGLIVGTGVGLIIDYLANGDDSQLGKIGTKIGEGAAKAYLWVKGLF